MRRYWLPATLLATACLLIGGQVLLRDTGPVPARRQTKLATEDVSSEATTSLAGTNVPAAQGIVEYQHCLNLLSGSQNVVDRSLEEIERGWHPGAAVMLVEVAMFAQTRNASAQAIALLERKSGQQFAAFDAWYHWIWNRKYAPHPQYARFKSELYSRIDERFSEYFEETEGARIRLDEVRWGGVVRDGIPPLKDPKMIPAEDATYLDDSNVVFGVKLNGDARCYPKRILAWHEMFKDTIGTVPVCGAY